MVKHKNKGLIHLGIILFIVILLLGCMPEHILVSTQVTSSVDAEWIDHFFDFSEYDLTLFLKGPAEKVDLLAGEELLITFKAQPIINIPRLLTEIDQKFITVVVRDKSGRTLDIHRVHLDPSPITNPFFSVQTRSSNRDGLYYHQDGTWYFYSFQHMGSMRGSDRRGIRDIVHTLPSSHVLVLVSTGGDPLACTLDDFRIDPGNIIALDALAETLVDLEAFPNQVVNQADHSIFNPQSEEDPALQRSDADFLTFTFPGASMTIDEEVLHPDAIGADGVIFAAVPTTANLGALVATFTSSEGARGATVEGRLQRSGTTSNDFRTAITYLVTAEDGTTKRWKVIVSSNGAVNPGQLVRVNHGSFDRGDEIGDLWTHTRPVHFVTLSYDFWTGKYPVTYEEYDGFCDATGRDKPANQDIHGQWGRGMRPVVNVSWWDAIAYCNWLSEDHGLPKAYDEEGNLLDSQGEITTDITIVEGFRLLTSAEWEYAASGGHMASDPRFLFSGSNDPQEVAWYGYYDPPFDQTYGPFPIGLKKPNQLGLFDMSGNVSEWCHDWYEAYTEGNKNNPIGPTDGDRRVWRSGGWGHGTLTSRIAYWSYNAPFTTGSFGGFRIARTIVGDLPEPTDNMTFVLTFPTQDVHNFLVAQQIPPKTVTVQVANGTNSVVITATKTAAQTVVVGGTNAANVTSGGTAIGPTHTVATADIAVAGGTKTFSLTVSEAGKADIVYTVTVNVAAPADPTANMVFELTTPEENASNTIHTDQAFMTVMVHVVNGTSSVVITGTKTTAQQVVVGGTHAGAVTQAGQMTTSPTFTVNTSDIVAGGGTKSFTLTVSETGKEAIIYAVTVTVAYGGPPASDQAEILAYGIPGQDGEAVITSNASGTIDITVPHGTGVTTLVATFTLSPGATATVNGTPQVSGTTSNDFTDPVTYTVTAEDGVTTKIWTVTVTVEDPFEFKMVSAAAEWTSLDLALTITYSGPIEIFKDDDGFGLGADQFGLAFDTDGPGDEEAYWIEIDDGDNKKLIVAFFGYPDTNGGERTLTYVQGDDYPVKNLDGTDAKTPDTLEVTIPSRPTCMVWDGATAIWTGNNLHVTVTYTNHLNDPASLGADQFDLTYWPEGAPVIVNADELQWVDTDPDRIVLVFNNYPDTNNEGGNTPLYYESKTHPLEDAEGLDVLTPDSIDVSVPSK